jgi:methionine-rich copper-binding protein CopC
VTLPELADALDDSETKVAVAKAFAHAIMVDPRVDVELRWASIPNELRLHFVNLVQRVIVTLREPALPPAVKPAVDVAKAVADAINGVKAPRKRSPRS